MEHIWVHSASCSQIPPYAVLGGHDSDGSPIYVGRSFHEGDNLPAKVVPNKNQAYVSWGGNEIVKSHYEVLTGEHYNWIPCAAGSVPPNAVIAGNTVAGEPLYIGRGHWQGSLTVGKIQPSHHCLYIPFGGREHRLDTYEVLTKGRKHIWPPAPVQPPQYGNSVRYEVVTTRQQMGGAPSTQYNQITVMGVGNNNLVPAREQHVWVPASLQYTPPGAVVAGHDSDKSTIYVGRANNEGEVLPAKIVPHNGGAYVCFGGHEIFKREFEVLTGHGYRWVKAHKSTSIPPGAVSTGHTFNGDLVYVGRGEHKGSLTPGKVHPSHHGLYIPYGGKEVKLTSYEVLTKY